MKLPLLFKFRLYRSLMASLVSLSIVWGSWYAFTTFDRRNTENDFMDRQYGIIAYTSDVLLDTKKISPFVVSTFESMLKKGNLGSFIPDKEAMLDKNLSGLISYGNFMFFYNEDLKVVSGFLEKNYKSEDDHIAPLNPIVHEKLYKLISRAVKENSRHSGIVDLGDKRIMLTALKIKLQQGDFTYVLYGDYDYVMGRLMFKKRKEVATIICVILSAIVFLFATMVIRGLFREATVFAKLQDATEELTEEVAARKNAEDSLRKSEETLRQAFEHARDAIFWIDPENGIIINCNRKSEKLLGKSTADISGCHFSILAPSGYEKDFVDMFTEHMESGSELDTESEIKSSSGEVTPTLISSSAITVGGKRVIQSIFRDITLLKKEITRNEQLKEQLMQSQKMEAVGTLAGGVAHDFNNLLAVIMGNSQLVSNKLPADSPLQEKLSRMISATLSAKDLTMKLLTFSRKDMLNIETIKPGTVVSEMVEMLKRGTNKNINIKTDIADCSCYISADFNQLLQALLNIGINARDSMTKGGTIEITAGKSLVIDSKAAAKLEVDPGSYCVIEIKDSGSGIPADVLPKIFDPFFTTKERGKGTGLGLSISKGIVEKLGGAIDVISNEGEGTTFSVFLPGAVSTKKDTENQKVSIPRGNGETVLLVDDDEMFSSMAADMLENWGYDVVVASSGNEAIRVFEDKGKEIALIILDMIMPEQDGTEVFWKLRDIGTTPIALCSGYSKDGNAESLVQHGAAAYIQKPFTAQELLSTVAAVIRKESP